MIDFIVSPWLVAKPGDTRQCLCIQEKTFPLQWEDSKQLYSGLAIHVSNRLIQDMPTTVEPTFSGDHKSSCIEVTLLSSLWLI